MDRRLTAILAADVAGYSRLLRADEAGTLSSLKSHRKDLVDGQVSEHRGRIVKLMGDGMLIEFPSVLDAVACAAAIQRGMRERNLNIAADRQIEFRIGIHLGDIVVEEDDIYGDGLNVAARIEGLAKPGGIAVSAAVRDSVGNRLDVGFEDRGDQNLKNIDRPVRIYNVSFGAAPAATMPALADTGRRVSIAVLPFTNMSGDPEQEYFVDGLVEDVITGLSKMPGLFVIARNSSFTYKGKVVDIRQVAKELGVRYVLEGSVRKAANRLRITGQLIEGGDATHIWADKFEGALEDVFELQDRMTERIVGALEPSLRRAEINRARNKRPDSLDAYDQFLRAMPHAYANTAAGREEALRILADVLRLDPNYAAAHAFKAWCHEQRYFRSGFHSEDKAGALEHAALAMTLGADDPQALSIGAFVRAIVAKEHEAAIAALDRSLDMNGNSALAYGFSAQVHVQFGNYDRAIQHAERAVRLSPFDPFNYNAYMAQAFSYFLTDRFAEGINFGKLAVQSNPTLSPCHAMLIANLVMADRLDEARHSAERMLEVDPAATAEGFVRAAWARPDLMERFGSALRKAGVPA